MLLLVVAAVAVAAVASIPFWSFGQSSRSCPLTDCDIQHGTTLSALGTVPTTHPDYPWITKDVKCICYPDLKHCGGSLTLSAESTLERALFPRLLTIEGSLVIRRNDELRAVDLSTLRSIGGNMEFHTNPRLGSLSTVALENLESVGAQAQWNWERQIQIVEETTPPVELADVVQNSSTAGLDFYTGLLCGFCVVCTLTTFCLWMRQKKADAQLLDNLKHTARCTFEEEEARTSLQTEEDQAANTLYEKLSRQEPLEVLRAEQQEQRRHVRVLLGRLARLEATNTPSSPLNVTPETTTDLMEREGTGETAATSTTTSSATTTAGLAWLRYRSQHPADSPPQASANAPPLPPGLSAPQLAVLDNWVDALPAPEQERMRSRMSSASSSDTGTSVSDSSTVSDLDSFFLDLLTSGEFGPVDFSRHFGSA